MRGMPRATRPVELTLDVGDGPAPLRHRLADAVVAELRAGRLRPGDALPSTRSLAAALGLSRGPVVAAYDELAAAGFVVSRAGSGAVVARGADAAAAAGAVTHVHTPRAERPGVDRPTGAPPRWDLRPGRPDTSLVDPAAWRRAWRAAGSGVPGNDAGAGPSHGRLRRVLAEHLRRSRGVAVDPDDLLVVPGVGASLRALPAALGLVGATVALEDPGYVEAWTAFSHEGARVVGIPVDEDGLDPAALPRAASAVYVTPSHQYPLGARMPVTRRARLLEWARRTGGLVLEDDYDGEFRYDVSPLPALRSLPGAEEHVVYIGTASKLVAPSLRVAWVAPPRRLREPLRVELESRGLMLGINAHINHDLALALVDVLDDWDTLDGEHRLLRQEDRELVNTIIDETTDEVQREVVAQWSPLASALDLLLGPLDEVGLRHPRPVLAQPGVGRCHGPRAAGWLRNARPQPSASGSVPPGSQPSSCSVADQADVGPQRRRRDRGGARTGSSRAARPGSPRTPAPARRGCSSRTARRPGDRLADRPPAEDEHVQASACGSPGARPRRPSMTSPAPSTASWPCGAVAVAADRAVAGQHVDEGVEVAGSTAARSWRAGRDGGVHDRDRGVGRCRGPGGRRPRRR